MVSDFAAIFDINTGHHYAPGMAHAAADALTAGTDLECGWARDEALPALVDAVHQGLLTEGDLDNALRRLFRTRFKRHKGPPPAPVYPLDGVEKRFASAHIRYAAFRKGRLV